MKTRIHINLAVRDLEASTAFYRRLFATDPTKTRQGYANWRLDQPALHLALVHDPAARPASGHERHFGVELFDNDDLADWQSRLQKQGVELRLEEQVTCCFAVGNKFWAKDPDGNEWEFWVRTAEAESMTGAENAACCTPEAKAEAIAANNPCCSPSAKSKEGAKANAIAGACC